MGLSSARSTAVDLLAYPTCPPTRSFLDGYNPMASSLEHSGADMPNLSPLLPFPIVSLQLWLNRLRSIGTLCSLATTLVLLLMALRTLRYILRRRQGLAGPGPAIRLLQFWTIVGLLHPLSLLMFPYLSIFNLSWMLQISLFGLLLTLSVPRSPLSTFIYHGPLTRFYDTHAPEIERVRARARAARAAADDVALQLARYLLDHLAAGGLSGLLTALSATLAPPPPPTLGEEVAEKVGSGAARLPERASGGPGAASAARGSSRAFFGGVADERARAVADGAVVTAARRRAGGMEGKPGETGEEVGDDEADAVAAVGQGRAVGFVRVGKVGGGVGEVRRTAYEGSRAMRAEFLTRRRSTGASVPNGGGG